MNCVNVSLCSSLTRQKKGHSNSNTTSRYNRESMARIVFVYIQSITKIFEKKSHICQWLAIVHQQRANRLFVSWRRYSYFLAVSVGTAFCLAFCCAEECHTKHSCESELQKEIRASNARKRVFEHAFFNTRLRKSCACVLRVRWLLISDLYCTPLTFCQ